MTKFLDYTGLSHLTEKIKQEIDNKAAAANRLAGLVIPFAGSTAPVGYLMCNGAAVSRTEYSELYQAIGTTYGTGDGSTTFNIPNLQERVPVGSSSSYALGAKGGEATHKLTTSEMPSHTHPTNIRVQTSYPTARTSGTNGWLVDSSSGIVTSGSTGGNAAHNNMQPYTVVNYIISTGKTASTADVTLLTDVIQQVAALQQNWNSLSQNGDYVVEQGVSEKWTYRKWSSGIAECWAKFGVTLTAASWTAWDTEFGTGTIVYKEPYPFEFVDVPLEMASGAAGSQQSYLIAEHLNTATYTSCYRLYRPTAGYDCWATVDLHVIGKWK